jgi:hypothetical protein
MREVAFSEELYSFGGVRRANNITTRTLQTLGGIVENLPEFASVFKQ